MRSSRQADNRSTSRACDARQLAPRSDRIVAVEEQRPPHERGEVVQTTCPPPAASAGVGHSDTHQRRASAASRTGARAAGGASQHAPDRRPPERARVLRRVDRHRRVRPLGLGELERRKAVEVHVPRGRPEPLLLPGQRHAQQRPRLALQQRALEGEQQRRGERRRAHHDLLPGARPRGSSRTAARRSAAGIVTAASAPGSARPGARAARRGSSAARPARPSGTARAAPSGA